MNTTSRPNILLITSDQQHWNTLGTVNPEIKTPNIDGLSRAGAIFTRAYCPNPTCTPTRASILTGLYPSQHGAYSLGTKLPEDQVTLGDLLQEAGYRTGLIGKGHLQPLRSTSNYPSLESHPLLRDLDFWRQFDQPFYGFEHVEFLRNHADEPHVGQHYALWMEEQGLLDWRQHFRNHWEGLTQDGPDNPAQQRHWSLPYKYHYNNWLAARSCEWMEDRAHQEEPFFLWASFPDPHPPYLVPEPWDKMYDPDQLTIPRGSPGEHAANPPHFAKTQEARPDFSYWQESEGSSLHGCCSHLHNRQELSRDVATYYGMISAMDDAVGDILKKLDNLGIADNTIVIYTSDHGHLFGQHGLIEKGPFHYEDLIRVPFIVRWPGKVPGNTTLKGIQSLVDLSPTLLELAGLPVPRFMSGVSQKDVWTGQRPSARSFAIVENRHQPNVMNLRTYVTERYKITTYAGAPYGELFDLAEDPGEVCNRWDDPSWSSLKAELLMEFLHAEMGKESTLMPRISGA